MPKRKNIFITPSAKATRDLAREILPRLLESNIVCLEGDLGAGKTTFTQGLLKTLGARGPYTSPTFAIMKHYRIHRAYNIKHGTKKVSRKNLFHVPCSMIHAAYHIDAYRIGPDDMLKLGWQELIADPQNFFIIEWPERIKKIIPKSASWLNFKWLDDKQRKISLK